MGSVRTRAGIFGILILAALIFSSSIATRAQTSSPSPSPEDLVLHAANARTIVGNWSVVDDPTAAGGRRLWNPDRGLAKLTSPLAAPADYFEVSFTPVAGRAYRLWVRGQAENNAWTNDSVFVQFSGAQDASGTAAFRVGTTAATTVSIEEGGGKGLSGWGWSDNGYDAMGPLVYFETADVQTLRVQRREDGISIDQIVLSPASYLTTAPGTTKNDTTLLAEHTGTPPPAIEIALGVGQPSTIAGTWQVIDDATAAGGKAVWTPNAGAPKASAPLAAPASFVEYKFHADAGRLYRLWVRGRAEGDHWANDSLFVQFDGSLLADGATVARIGSSSGYTINLEEGSSVSVSGWGWQDNGYGVGVLGALIMFEETGLQTIRLQNREDGFRVDQILLSSQKYLTSAPGATKNDTTIVVTGTSAPTQTNPQQPSSTPTQPPQEPPPPTSPTPSPTPSPDPSPTTVFVAAGGNLQAALDAARPGDTLLLEPGATFVGEFVLPVKDGATFITVRSATPDAQLPDPLTRISPAASPLLAKLRSSTTSATLRTAPGAHHWRIQLLEFAANVGGQGDIIQIGDGSRAQSELPQVPYEIEFDRVYVHGDPLIGQKRGIALNGRAVTIRNSYISDIRAVGMDTQAIGGWNGPGPVLVENNYLEAAGENFMLGGADPAIPNLVTENVVIRRNHMTRPVSWKAPVVTTPANVTASLAGAGSLGSGTYTYRVVASRTVTGGVVARSAASSPASIDVPAGSAVALAWTAVPDAAAYTVYAHTSFGGSQYWTVQDTAFVHTAASGQPGAAPTSAGHTWTVKNLLELKNARNVLIEQNVFENHWAGAQPGYAFVFTPRNQDGGCAWCVVENVTFQQNIARNISSGFNILGHDDINSSLRTNRIHVSQNLFTGVGAAGPMGGNGWFLLMGNGPRDITFDHNTVDSRGTTLVYVYEGPSGKQVDAFRFTNNAARHGDYGINGSDGSFGNGVITAFFPNGVVSGNWLESGYASRYPAGNYMDGTFGTAFVDAIAGDYSPRAGGPLVGRATDGSAIGADMAALSAIVQAVVNGSNR